MFVYPIQGAVCNYLLCIRVLCVLCVYCVCIVCIVCVFSVRVFKGFALQ